MACDYQALLDANTCLSALPASVLETLRTALLCNMAGGATLENAVEVEPLVQAITLNFGDPSRSLAEILTGSATTFMVRSIRVTADTGNGAGDDVGVRKGALGVIFSVLAAGEYWESNSPAGTVFDANLLYVTSIQGSPELTVLAFR
jgi:hypothetical protein